MTAKDKEIGVTVNIQPGPVTPAQKQAWHRFWQKLIAKAKSETGECQ